ncbi:hypothetical protein [Ureibacillus manganicus]|uniref:Uncharacterized protein n=1 Tax=Ureibacillus manganicus DSM 26584 TaxID=1384049 RepID=A0A0A3IVL4_9BACL|nr:hypothetical protein [Ureibacillus manganicus]KGR78857.1 hypothetical protein CD29_09270 [Ureibacillus manganicus DSM 26584]
MKLKKTTAALLVAGLTIAGSSYAWANETVFNSEDEQKEASAEVTTASEIESVVTIDSTENESDETTSNTELNEDTTKNEDISKEESTENENNEVAKETNNTTNEDEKNESSENDFPEIPEGYTAGNLVALKQAYENAGNENAKNAILKNAHKAIAKFEAKHGTKEVETKAEVEVNLELIGVKKPGETIIQPIINENVKEQETAVSTKETTAKSETKLSTKEQQKADKKAHKEQQKEEKKASKENKGKE